MYHLHPLAALAIKTIPRLLDTLHVLSFPELVSAAGAQHFHRAEGCRSIAAGVFSFFSICFLLVPVVSTEVSNEPGFGTLQ